MMHEKIYHRKEVARGREHDGKRIKGYFENFS
jgi:hypothetical protein